MIYYSTQVNGFITYKELKGDTFTITEMSMGDKKTKPQSYDRYARNSDEEEWYVYFNFKVETDAGDSVVFDHNLHFWKSPKWIPGGYLSGKPTEYEERNDLKHLYIVGKNETIRLDSENFQEWFKDTLNNKCDIFRKVAKTEVRKKALNDDFK